MNILYESLILPYKALYRLLTGSRHAQLATYTVFDEESESEVKNAKF